MRPDEGYIKYHCEWIKAPPLPAALWQSLDSWRAQLYGQGLIGAYADGIGFGNVSQRQNDQQFMISGSATGQLPVLDGQHYALVTSFDLAANLVRCEGPIKASSEAMSHAVIYQELAWVQAVFHVHSLPMWKYFLHRLPTTAEGVAYGTPEMGREIIRLLRATNVAQDECCFVMGGHREGIMAFGESPDAAGAHLLRQYERSA